MKIKVLFICLGNICRSPSAEAVFKHYIEQQNLAHLFEVDSAGIISAHQGEPADKRMREHSFVRGYRLDSLSRPITYNDFEDFDYLICMDDSNYSALMEKAPTLELSEKVSLLTSWSSTTDYDHVPDPYYGGSRGFEIVLDLLEECIPELVAKILAKEGVG